MDRHDERKLAGYYRAVRSWLPCSRRQKKTIMNQLRSSIAGYQEEHPAVGFDQVREHFGEPKAIASAFVEDMDTGELLGALRVKRRIVTAVAGTALVLVLMWGIGVGMAILDSHANGHGAIEEYVVDASDNNSQGEGAGK